MGKHRALHATSRRGSVARLMTPGGLAVAALGATSLSSALITGATTAVAPSVDLVALITPSNSTAQIFAGTTYYGNDYTDDGYGPQQVVPFFLGPQGIADAIREAQDEPTIVTASGWGAGQTGTALGILANNDDEDDLSNVDLVILDNNSNRGGGGFWTTYSPFAPLLLTSAEPTPSNLGVPVLDVAYEYNINSSAPVDPLNPFAMANTLVAYVYGYGGEQTAVVPDEIIAEAGKVDGPHYHYVLDADGNVVGEPTLLPGSTTTYVTFEADGLPLVRPLRLLPGGDIVADALEPTLTELVNAGYADGLGMEGNEAIPVDPTKARTMQPGSSLTALDGVPESIGEGAEAGVKTAKEDLSNPSNFVTKPLEEVASLPLVSTFVEQPEREESTIFEKVRDVDAKQTLVDDTENSETQSPAKTKPGQRFAKRVDDVVKKVTDGGFQRAENDTTTNDE